MSGVLPEPSTPPAEKIEATVGVSQGRLIFRRFLEHKLSLIAIFVLIAIFLISVAAVGIFDFPGWWKWKYTELSERVNGGAPTLSIIPKFLGGDGITLGEHPFGQTLIGIDYFAMTMRGIQNSYLVAFVVGILVAIIGTTVGAVAGYYRGWVEAVLMRLTDLIIVIPIIVLAAVLGVTAGNQGLGALGIAVVIGLVAWTGLARLVRGEFISLREREYVDAARVSGAKDLRIIFRHILPNSIGVVIVATTLIMAAAILLEAALSFLGFGIRTPDISLGSNISSNQSAFSTRPYLFIWPGVLIVVIALSINLVGDGLRDAFDPRQRRFRAKKTKEQG